MMHNQETVDKIRGLCEKGAGYYLTVSHPLGGEVLIYDRQVIQLLLIAERNQSELSGIKAMFRRIVE